MTDADRRWTEMSITIGMLYGLAGTYRQQFTAQQREVFAVIERNIERIFYKEEQHDASRGT
jgi:hypothetical protein